MEQVFQAIAYLQEIYWSYIGWALICCTGLYLTVKSGGFQFKVLSNFKTNFNELLKEGKRGDRHGIHPFKLYFASIGGMVGIGNIVSVGAAVMIGGPGSIFWMWVACFSGMLLKYSEIYLGIKHRVSCGKGSFNGGPMYYLQEAFTGKLGKFLSYLFAVLLCVYGIEVFQFTVLVDRIEHTFHFDRIMIIAVLAVMSVYTVMGGIKRLSSICSVMMPFFMIGYIAVCLYIIGVNYGILPTVVIEIFRGAFEGHAPIGGFVGSTMLMAAYQGTSRAVYAGDIGVGFDSCVQSETMISDPRKQAQIAIYALFTDTFICMMTTLLLAVTGAWYSMNDAQSADVVSIVLSSYLPHADIFMTILLFFAGFTTVVAYFAVGVKNAMFISPKYGKWTYILLGICSFAYFPHFPADDVMQIMLFISGCLVLINVFGILKLIKEVKF